MFLFHVGVSTFNRLYLSAYGVRHYLAYNSVDIHTQKKNSVT